MQFPPNMNPKIKPVEVAAPTAEASSPAPPADGEPGKHTTAMKLPPGVSPKGANRPQPHQSWKDTQGGRPQKDFARRAGRSRKVH